VGAALKRQFDETISFDPDHTFDDAQDLMNAVENNTDIKLYIYDKEDIQKLKDTIPALSTIKGTAKFHEVLAKKDGTLYAKNISNEKEKQLNVKFHN
jgi:hypothetical protein